MIQISPTYFPKFERVLKRKGTPFFI